MPYIPDVQRDLYDTYLRKITSKLATPGQLTYIIYSLCLHMIERRGRYFGTFATIMGVLTCVGKELYRKEIAPYGDEKIAENGDVKLPLPDGDVK